MDDTKHILRNLLKDTLETVIPAIILALLINLFLAQGTYVHGQSMEPNLRTNQRLMLEKISYKLHPPQRGDIVVVDVEISEIPLIKRVVGLPGETIAIQNNQVYINGKKLDEQYLANVIQQNYGPIVAPPQHVFAMGDNRGASNDSRAFGSVPAENILGRAWFSY